MVSRTCALLLMTALCTPSIRAAECEAALLPTMDVTVETLEWKNAWLRVIDEKTFEQFKETVRVATGAGGALPIEGIPVEFNGFFDGDWERFEQRRRQYFNAETSKTELAYAKAIIRQSLTPEQLEAYGACTAGAQLSVLLSNDTQEFVSALVRYNGTPGTKASIVVDVTNGSVGGQSSVAFALHHGGSRTLTIARSAADADIVVDANSENTSLSANAMSVWPVPSTPSEASHIEISMPDPPHAVDATCSTTVRTRPTPIIALNARGSLTRISTLSGTLYGGNDDEESARCTISVDLLKSCDARRCTTKVDTGHCVYDGNKPNNGIYLRVGAQERIKVVQLVPAGGGCPGGGGYGAGFQSIILETTLVPGG